MYEKHNKHLSKYDIASTEQLEEILRLDALSTKTAETDLELLLYIMGVLAGRNTSYPSKSAHEAWNSFLQHWLPFANNYFTPTLLCIGTSQSLPQ